MWLNIVLICVCVVCAGIGVYMASRAADAVNVFLAGRGLDIAALQRADGKAADVIRWIESRTDEIDEYVKRIDRTLQAFGNVNDENMVKFDRLDHELSQIRNRLAGLEDLRVMVENIETSCATFATKGDLQDMDEKMQTKVNACELSEIKSTVGTCATRLNQCDNKIAKVDGYLKNLESELEDTATASAVKQLDNNIGRVQKQLDEFAEGRELTAEPDERLDAVCDLVEYIGKIIGTGDMIRISEIGTAILDIAEAVSVCRLMLNQNKAKEADDPDRNTTQST